MVREHFFGIHGAQTMRTLKNKRREQCRYLWQSRSHGVSDIGGRAGFAVPGMEYLRVPMAIVDVYLCLQNLAKFNTFGPFDRGCLLEVPKG